MDVDSVNDGIGMPKRCGTPPEGAAHHALVTASCITQLIGIRQTHERWGPTPSASKAANALDPSWIPAAISPSSWACRDLTESRAAPAKAAETRSPRRLLKLGLLKLSLICKLDYFDDSQ